LLLSDDAHRIVDELGGEARGLERGRHLASSRFVLAAEGGRAARSPGDSAGFLEDVAL
jgi:hypothetical protein